MKSKLFFHITLWLSLSTVVSSGFSQEYIQWRLPESAEARIGKGIITDIKFSPDDTILAVASSVGVWLYDSQTGDEIVLLKERNMGNRWANTLAFSLDGNTLACGISRDNGPIQLWDTTTGEKNRTLTGEMGSIRSLTFSPDGTLLFCAGNHRNMQLTAWNLTTGQQVLGYSDQHTSYFPYNSPLVFSQDARYVAAGIDNSVKIWEVTKKKSIHTFDKDLGMTPRSSLTQALALSVDGKTLASAWLKIRLWDVESGTELGFLPDQPRVIVEMAFTPDREYLVTGNAAGVIQLWNTEKKQPVFHTSISGHKTLPFNSFSITTDSNTLASGSRDGTIRIWDLKSKIQKVMIQGHTERVKALEFLKDGKTFFSCGSDGVFRYYNVDTGTEKLIPTEQTWYVFACAISKDEKMIASGNVDGIVKLWSTETNSIVATHKGHQHGSIFHRLQFSNDGKTLGSVSMRGEAIVWDIHNRKQLYFLPGDRSDYISPSEIAFSPDLRILAIAKGDKVIQLWDTHSNKDNNQNTKLPINAIPIGQVVRALAFSSDGRTLISGDWRGTIMLWDVETGQQIAEFIDAKGSIAALKFSPDGSIIAKGGESGAIELWDVETKSRIWYNRDAHSSSVTHFAFTPDQKTLVTGSADGTMFIWNLNNLKHNGR